MTLSLPTIRFRLWQLRLSNPEITQFDAAAEIGCTPTQLRAATPDSGKRRPSDQPFRNRPENVGCDEFIESASYYLSRAEFRERLTVVNGSLL